VEPLDVPSAIRVGPILFEYDGRGIGVGSPEELRGYAEPFSLEEWTAFLGALGALELAGNETP
jgi:hypothetical protein